MHDEDAKSLGRFLNEIRMESNRGLTLIGAAFIDEKLANTLQAFFCKEAPDLLFGKNAPLGAFSARIETCHALALIDDIEWHDCNCIRKIRNAFAHDVLTAAFNDQRIASLCSNLKSQMPEPKGEYTSRERFQNAVIAMAVRLYYRAEYVKREKRAPKIWVEAESIRWRKVATEPPPTGVPVLAYGTKNFAVMKKQSDSESGS